MISHRHRHFLVSIGWIAGIFLMARCGNFGPPPPKPSRDVDPNSNSNVTVKPNDDCSKSKFLELNSVPNWQDSVSTIFTNNCLVSCHGSEYQSYSNVKSDISSITSVINSGFMPKGFSMSATDKQTLQQWVTAGMPEKPSTTTTTATTTSSTTISMPTTSTTKNSEPDPSTATCTPAPVTTTTSTTVSVSISYASDVKPIMTTYCSTCHSSKYGQLPYLETYDEVKLSYSAVFTDISSGRMPKGPTKLNADQISKISNWQKGQFLP